MQSVVTCKEGRYARILHSGLWSRPRQRNVCTVCSKYMHTYKYNVQARRVRFWANSFVDSRAQSSSLTKRIAPYCTGYGLHNRVLRKVGSHLYVNARLSAPVAGQRVGHGVSPSPLNNSRGLSDGFRNSCSAADLSAVAPVGFREEKKERGRREKGKRRTRESRNVGFPRVRRVPAFVDGAPYIH